jgi:biopolymer transport protein ExbD
MTRRRQRTLPSFEDCTVDLSPLIDLVFLLLIFFMTSSTIITYLKDSRIDLPISEDARVPKAVAHRILINVYEDGRLGDEHGAPIDPETLERRLRNAAPQGAKIQIRPDRRVKHGDVRQVLNAARRAGIEEVIFTAYTSEN